MPSDTRPSPGSYLDNRRGPHISQLSIIGEVQTERQCQDARWGAVYDDSHRRNDWIAMLARAVGLAAIDSSVLMQGDEKSASERFRRQMIRISALAIAAAESHDRKTGSTRDHVVRNEGSGF